MNFGERISRLRKNRGMTQRELADALNISRAALSHYENNRRLPDYDMLRRISELLGVRMSELMEDAPAADSSGAETAPPEESGPQPGGYRIVHLRHAVYPDRLL